MEAVFDLEADGFLESVGEVHSLCLLIDGQMHSFHHDTIKDGLSLLGESLSIVGHNVICYDLPVLKKLYGFEPHKDCKIYDTLTVSRLIYPDLMGNKPHSLSSWGKRLKVLKTEYKGSFDTWSQEMQDYCEQDVNVTKALYDKLLSENYSGRAVNLELQFQKIIHKQEQNGVPFDVKKARELVSEVGASLADIESRIAQSVPRIIKRKPPKTPKVGNRKLGRRAGCDYTPISFHEFNPGSRQQIVQFLKQTYGWEPTIFNESGNAKVDAGVLSELPYPEAELFGQYFERKKILGFLKDGDNAWLKLHKRGRLHGRVNTNGTWTSRITSSKPNLTQVPSVRKYMGKECRSLFHSGNGFMVGIDVSGLELRMLAHYLSHYDGGEYGRKILEGDIHSENQKAAGLDTRDQAKTFIYALIYGAGFEKIGEISGKDGKTIKNRFIRNIPGLYDLINDVQRASSRGYLKSIDGRRVPIRSEHSALNFLLQSSGSIVCKKANCIFWDTLPKDVNCYQVIYCHDEAQQITNIEEHTTIIGEAYVNAIEKSGEFFNLRIPMTGEYKVGRSWCETH